MPNKDFSFKEWYIQTTIDDDGHLRIWVSHKDDSGVETLEIDDGWLANGWAETFTTKKIESDYNARIKN